MRKNFRRGEDNVRISLTVSKSFHDMVEDARKEFDEPNRSDFIEACARKGLMLYIQEKYG